MELHLRPPRFCTMSLRVSFLVLLFQNCASFGAGGNLALPTTSSAVAAERRILHEMEAQRLKELQEELAAKSIRVHGFYHIATMLQHWPEVYQEQLRILAGYHRDLNIQEGPRPIGLIDLVEKLHVYEAQIVGVPRVRPELTADSALRSLGLGIEDKVKLMSFPSIDRAQYTTYQRRNRTHELIKRHEEMGLTLGENPTIIALHEHCKAEVAANRQSVVFYMHLKSAGQVVQSDTAASRATAPAFWREVMNTLTLEFSSICLRALLAGSSICGSLYRHIPTSHFAGNFFWASCNHVAQLPSLPSPVTDFEAAEFFLMRTNDDPAKTAEFATHCAYEVLSTWVPRRFYRSPVLPAEYIRRLHELLAARKLPACGISVNLEGPSFLCQHNATFKNRPCLSALVEPDPKLRNYYNVTSSAAVKSFSWGHS